MLKNLSKKNVVLCLVSLTIGISGTLLFLDPPETIPTASAQSTAMVPIRQFTPEEQRHINIYENANQSVVNISVVTGGRSFFMDPSADSPDGIGSGSVFDYEGHVLTNNHVIAGARVIQVTLYDGKTYNAKVVGQDEQSDVAVLKIDAPRKSLFPVVLGNSSGLKVGQQVYAIGNPFGFERTLSTGIIASLNRSFPVRPDHTMRRLIQIDASINPGNSGGPLLDSSGRLIGMNTAIASMTGDSAGVGFAIPVNDLTRIVPQLIEKGHFTRADIGILTVFEHKNGLLIRTLEKGGPAEQAGLRGPKIVIRTKQQGPYVYQYRTLDRTAADLVIAIDGNKVEDTDQFLAYLESKKPGDQVVLTIIRDETPKKVTITLASDE